jgi:hypothetical protein
MKLTLSVLVVACAMPIAVSAQSGDLVITSLSKNGLVSWQDTRFTNAAYRLEWSPNVASQWFSGWSGLQSIVSTSSQMSASVPMLYRIVRETQVGLAPRSLKGKSYRYYENGFPPFLNALSTFGDTNGVVTWMGLGSDVLSGELYASFRIGTFAYSKDTLSPHSANLQASFQTMYIQSETQEISGDINTVAAQLGGPITVSFQAHLCSTH